MTGQPESSPTLEYGSAPHPLRRRRVKWAIATVVAVAILVPAWALLAPRVERRWQFLDSQRAWREMSRVPGQHAFFDRWHTTRDSSGRSSGSSAESSHFELRRRYGMPQRQRVATLYLQARRTPGGRERLVVVELALPPGGLAPPSAAAPAPVGLTLEWYTGVPGGWVTEPSDLRAGAITLNRPPAPATGETLFFNGQADPKDPSRFTIPFSMDGVRGALDGQLLPDGNVGFTVSSGPLTIAPGSATGGGSPPSTNRRTE